MTKRTIDADTLLNQAKSASGWTWYNVILPNGRTGWIFAYWTKLTS